MPAAATNPVTCTSCGMTAPMHTMLMNDQGALTCASCLARTEMQASARKRAKNVMLAPAMVSVLAYLSFLIPLVNIAAPGILAALAIWSAVGGIRLHGEMSRMKDFDGVSRDLRTGLLVMSILTIVFAAIPLLIQIFAWVAIALAPSHPRYDF
jgi:hypothetical protein